MNSLVFNTFINDFKPQVDRLFLAYQTNAKSTYIKSDGSLVTELDHSISEAAEALLNRLAPTCNFVSEEKEIKGLTWPALVIDPIDGTKELVANIPEVAVSVAYMNSQKINDSLNQGWIYNPFNQIFGHSLQEKCLFEISENLTGLISRTEVSRGTQPLLTQENFTTKAIGSIAYKLLLLSQGKCNFVYSKQPKNIWDIAAGSILCLRNGFHLFQNGKEIAEFSKLNIKENLLWCKPELLKKIQSNLG